MTYKASRGPDGRDAMPRLPCAAQLAGDPVASRSSGDPLATRHTMAVPAATKL